MYLDTIGMYTMGGPMAKMQKVETQNTFDNLYLLLELLCVINYQIEIVFNLFSFLLSCFFIFAFFWHAV